MFRSIEKDTDAVSGMQHAIMYASKYAAQHHYGKEIDRGASEAGVKSYNVLRTSYRERDLGSRVLALVDKNIRLQPQGDRSPHLDQFMQETYSQLSERKRRKLARVALFGDGKYARGIKSASRGRVFIDDRGVDPALVVQLSPGEQPEDIFFANLVQELQNEQTAIMRERPLEDKATLPVTGRPPNKVAPVTTPISRTFSPKPDQKPTPAAPFEHQVVQSVQQAIDMAMHEKSKKSEFEIIRRSKKALAKAVLRRLVEFSSDQNISTLTPEARDVCTTIDNLADLQTRRWRTKRGKRELIEQAIDGIGAAQNTSAEVRPLTVATLGAVVLRITHNGYSRRYGLHAQNVRRPKRPTEVNVSTRITDQNRNNDGSFASSALVHA